GVALVTAMQCHGPSVDRRQVHGQEHVTLVREYQCALQNRVPPALTHHSQAWAGHGEPPGRLDPALLVRTAGDARVEPTVRPEVVEDRLRRRPLAIESAECPAQLHRGGIARALELQGL